MADWMQTCKKWYAAEIRFLKYLQPVLLLLLRLYFGWMFISAGLGKASDPAVAAKTLGGWGVPLPRLKVYMAGTAQSVGGGLLFFGAAARLITDPSRFTMVVRSA